MFELSTDVATRPERTAPAAPQNGHAAVVCRGLVKEFGSGETRLRVLHGIDLTVAPSEMTLLVGPSGCGKTTLISIIAGLLDPTAGEVSVFGVEQSSLSPSALVKFRGDKIGFVFQQYNLLPALTATQNVAIPLLIGRVAHRKAIARGREVMEKVGLGDKLDAYPSQLSGGQQQRVAIARALVHDPELLVCDEPTAALDAHSGRVIMELLRDVAVQQGRAVIVVTHDQRVFEFGDRIVEMSDGRILRTVTSQQWKAQNHERAAPES